MQLFIVPILAFACAVLVIAAPTLTRTANDLLRRATNLISTFKNMTSNVSKQRVALKPPNFALASQTKVIELQGLMGQKENKPGYATCRQQYDNDLRNVQIDLQNLVFDRLNSMEIALNTLIDTLICVQGRLTGPALADEIRTCQTSNICKLRANFTVSVSSAEYSLKYTYTDLLSSELTNTIIVSIIKFTMPDKIEKYILKPVKNCLRSL